MISNRISITVHRAPVISEVYAVLGLQLTAFLSLGSSWHHCANAWLARYIFVLTDVFISSTV